MKKATVKNSGTRPDADAATLIDARIAALGDWRGGMLARVRDVIRKADPDIVETVKWVKPSNPFGVPVWERDGIVCTGEIYREVVKLTFAAGAALDDPATLFNASLEGNARRAIDIRARDRIDEAALRALIRAAVDHNRSRKKTKTAGHPARRPARQPATTTTTKTTTTTTTATTRKTARKHQASRS